MAVEGMEALQTYPEERLVESEDSAPSMNLFYSRLYPLSQFDEAEALFLDECTLIDMRDGREERAALRDKTLDIEESVTFTLLERAKQYNPGIEFLFDGDLIEKQSYGQTGNNSKLTDFDHNQFFNSLTTVAEPVELPVVEEVEHFRDKNMRYDAQVARYVDEHLGTLLVTNDADFLLTLQWKDLFEGHAMTAELANRGFELLLDGTSPEENLSFLDVFPDYETQYDFFERVIEGVDIRAADAINDYFHENPSDMTYQEAVHNLIDIWPEEYRKEKYEDNVDKLYSTMHFLRRYGLLEEAPATSQQEEAPTDLFPTFDINNFRNKTDIVLGYSAMEDMLTGTPRYTELDYETGVDAYYRIMNDIHANDAISMDVQVTDTVVADLQSRYGKHTDMYWEALDPMINVLETSSDDPQESVLSIMDKDSIIVASEDHYLDRLQQNGRYDIPVMAANPCYKGLRALHR